MAWAAFALTVFVEGAENRAIRCVVVQVELEVEVFFVISGPVEFRYFLIRFFLGRGLLEERFTEPDAKL